jgi:hypothetical protein
MNFRFTGALLGAVLLVVVVLLFVSSPTEDKPAGDGLAAELLAVGAKVDDVDRVEIAKGDAAVVLVRTDKDRNAWKIEKPIGAQADASKVVPVVRALMTAKPTTYQELSPNPAVHGLDPVGLKVTLSKGQERSSTVNLGDVTMGDKGVVFVTTSAQAQRPMAVRRSDLDALFRADAKDGKAADLVKWTSDFRSQQVFPSESTASGGADVASVKFELPNKKHTLAVTQTAAGGWTFDSPAGWGAADPEGDPSGLPDKFTGVGPLLRAVANVTAATAADFIDQPKDLKEYGLNPDNPDLIRVEMKTKPGLSAVVYMGKFEGGTPAPTDKKDVPPPPAAPPKVYVRVEGVPGVIRASAVNLSGLAELIANPNPLRDRTLIATGASKAVDGVDILLPGQAPDQPTKLRKVSGEWRLYGGRNDPQSAYQTAAQRLADVVSAKRTIKDFPALNPADFAAPTTLYVWVDGFNPPIADKAEPAKRGEPVKLEFGRAEGETVYVRRTQPGGAVAVFTLPTTVKAGAVGEAAEVVKSVTLSRLDLLDRVLPSFSDTSPTRIAVSGTNNYVLAKDEKPDPSTKDTLWRFVEPAAQKGQVADGGAVRDLINLLATSQSAFDRFVDEGVADPATYGLNPPTLKVVVTVAGGKEETRGFEFGSNSKTVADADKVYARVVGKPAVFTIQRRALDRFASPDLRDRVIFRGIPVGQVTAAEFTGWGNITLKFEKNKDGVWERRDPTPPGFVPDPAKVGAFIEALSRTPVKSFEKGPPEPKHGFGDPTALKARLTWAGGEAYINFGASPDSGASYYGWTTALPAPDQIVTIDAGLFKPFKDAPSGFAK